LGQSATASLNRAQSLRDEVSVAQNQVDTISKDISSAHGKSLIVNKDLTQPILDYIAHQPVNSGPNGSPGGQIGYEGARLIMEGQGAEFDAYKNRFQEENPRYSIDSINSTSENANISSKFESKSAEVKANSDVDRHHAQNTGNILARAKRESNLDPNAPLISRQAETTTAIENQGKKIEKGKQGIEHQHNELWGMKEESQDKNLAGAVVGNTFKTFVTKGSPLASVLSDDFSREAKLPKGEHLKGEPIKWAAQTNSQELSSKTLDSSSMSALAVSSSSLASASLQTQVQNSSQALQKPPEERSEVDSPKFPPSTPQIRK
jgi:hypothetical protein